MVIKVITLAVGIVGFCTVSSNAQTTWADDIIVEGNMNVGTTADKGNLTVTGQTGSTAAPGVNVTGDGGVLFVGTLGVGSIPATGAGTRFMWYPGKGALRVGVPTDSSSWSDLNIGIGSFAVSKSLANGPYSVALSGGEAQGTYSTAMSYGLQAIICLRA